MAMKHHFAAFVLMTLAAACGPSFQEVRPTAPVVATAGMVRAQLARVLLTDDVPSTGVGDGTALVVELVISNDGPRPYGFYTAALSCLMELDPAHPGETLSLLPAWAGEGAFPGEGAAAEASMLIPMVIAPGQTRSYWAMFRGYRFPGSDVPRKITVALPGAGGPGPRLVAADPAHGFLRWQVTPDASDWMYGARSSSLYGKYTTVNAASTRIARVFRAGPLLWDLGLVSTILVQVKGSLISQSSSFTGSGLEGHLTAPLLTWGSWQDPRQVGLYAGGLAQFLISIDPPPPKGEMPRPHAYGEVDAEAGLQLDVGAIRLAASPFPLSYQGRRPLPRWLVRLGYTHAWIGHGSANGYTTHVELAW